MAMCSHCEADLALDERGLQVGEIVICRECGAELEVQSQGPLELRALDEEDDDDEGSLSA